MIVFSTTRWQSGVQPKIQIIPIGPAHHPPILHSMIQMASARGMPIIGTFGTGGNLLPHIATNTRAS
jgi:hypothetical protein